MNEFEFSWPQNYSNIFFFFFKIDLSLAFDHICYKLLYGFHSLGCKNDALNMFAIIFFYLIINFNVIFVFWSLFYSKSVINFHQREIAIVLFFLSFYMMNYIYIFIFISFVHSLTNVNKQASQSPEVFYSIED